MIADAHMHTVLCKHADGDVAEYRDCAINAGLAEICFTDHSPNPDGYADGLCMQMDEFDQYRQMVEGVQADTPLPVLFGTEVDFYPGAEHYLSEWLPRWQLDMVLGSVHYIDDWPFDCPSESKTWDTIDVAGAWRRYFEIVSDMVRTGLCDVVGHLDLPKKFGHRPPDKQVREMVQPLLDDIAGAGMAVEINTAGLRRPVGEMYPSPLVLSLAHEREIPITFGSDAHQPSEVGADFDQAIRLASEIGYTKYLRFRQRSSITTPIP